MEHRRVALVELAGDVRKAETFVGRGRETIGGELLPPQTKVTSHARASAHTNTHARSRTQILTRARVAARAQIIDVVWSSCVAEHDGTFEFTRGAICPHRLAVCGPGRAEADGGPCHLRHRDPIPLTALRPPVLSGSFKAI